MSRPRIVYTDPGWAKRPDGVTDPGLATVEREVIGDAARIEMGRTVEGRYPQGGPALHDLVRGADALVIYRVQVTPELLDIAGPQLKVVARQGVGYDNLAPGLLAERGIVGFNVPDYCVDEVATHTLALTLSLERGIVPQHQTLVGGKFDIYHAGTPRRLREAQVGIIGFGRIGRVVATRFGALYGSVVACDPFVEADMMTAYGVRKVDFETLLSTSDVVLMHCLLDDTTKGMMDERAFSLMKPGAYFVNAARGALVKAPALRQALEEGRIAGAGLDVFSPEDPHEDEDYRQVLKTGKVVVTSHRAFLSREAEISQRRRVAEGILRVLVQGEPPIAGLLTPGVRIRAHATV